ncbi:MAG: esterase [Cyanobium sp. PLM2.Bin73]|nr:MAG: esterase [Cyanobium sp. PLM2.Bin73]
MSGPSPTPPSPTLILGGFLITPEAYAPMAAAIGERSGQQVAVVPAGKGDWLLTSWSLGWCRLLDRSQVLLQELAAASPTGRVTLVGHSSGGVMLRLLLGDEPFAGRVYGLRDRVDTLLSLGSPHRALRGTALRRLVDQRYPGAFFGDQVRYVSVAGAIEPAQLRPRARRLVRRSYSAISDDPDCPGDGLVPVSSALLSGSEQRLLEGVGHGGWFAERWYGSPEVLPRWLDLLVA